MNKQVPLGFFPLLLLSTLSLLGSPAAGVPAPGVQNPGLAGRPEKVLGQDKIIGFFYLPQWAESGKGLRSPTLAFSSPAEWRYWRNRGVVPALGHTWFDLLKNSSVDKAADILTQLDYGGNPRPVVILDEFGFDEGGETDQRCAAILAATKRKKPELSLVVWEMRGPVPEVLARAYRECADLVLPECYVGNSKEYWWLASEVFAARAHGLLPKTVFGLGLGSDVANHENWANTKEELEQQIRFVRLLAPESPGIAFFAAHATPDLLAAADDLCARFAQIPTDGSGLSPEALAVAKTWSQPRDQPTLVLSPHWMQPNRDPRVDPNNLVEPKTLRAYIANLGRQDAKNVKVRLRAPKEAGGQLLAEGLVDVPSRGEAVAVCHLTVDWPAVGKHWAAWEPDLEAPGCEVMVFKIAK